MFFRYSFLLKVMLKNIEEKLAVLPHSPGVYIMKNHTGSIIYVGKSKNLKNRVSSYFQAPENLTSKTRKLVSNIADFEIIITQTEAEALLLENELIKRHMPKYNIKLKDSKSYPYIKISSEPYPRPEIEFERKNDKSHYFGPYTSSAAARDIIETIKKTFKLPSCDKKFCFGKEIGRPCLNYHIDRCIAPCTGKISQKEYSDIFDEIGLMLKGDFTAAEKSLEAKMNAASKALRFEAAAKYRDSIRNLQKLTVQQKIKSVPGTEKDVFGFYETDILSAVVILQVRDGVVIDKSTVFIGGDEISDGDALSDLVLRYYRNTESIPKEISLSFELDDEIKAAVSRILTERSGHGVTVFVPQRGKEKQLCAMAVNNASEAVKTKLYRDENDSSLLIKLAQLLKLEVVPERIESYDISNSGNDDIYCGMIAVENAKFKKSDYRAFAIKTTDGADDYGSMREALSRRFAHLKDESDKSSLSFCPDLILLDGGKGQVSAVKQVAEEMNIDIPIFGMVKDKYHKTRTITDGENEISIAKDNMIFSFVYKIQEEVHRYTFSKMDASRRKKMQKLELTEIKGVGNAKAKAIYEKFKTLENLKQASLSELCEVKGINGELAESIFKYLNSEKEN